MMVYQDVLYWRTWYMRASWQWYTSQWELRYTETTGKWPRGTLVIRLSSTRLPIQGSIILSVMPLAETKP